MADMRFGLPSNNYKKLKRAAALSDTALLIAYGIQFRELPIARAFITRRLEEMRAG